LFHRLQLVTSQELDKRNLVFAVIENSALVSLRTVFGAYTLQESLGRRENISQQICDALAMRMQLIGIKVEEVQVQRFQLMHRPHIMLLFTNIWADHRHSHSQHNRTGARLQGDRAQVRRIKNNSRSGNIFSHLKLTMLFGWLRCFAFLPTPNDLFCLPAAGRRGECSTDEGERGQP
jgi:hypothetical protein